ncbi:hypothetical protein M9H77_34126 [Catharanthus roseus]|uniref:Uncharacterized protein n=1 Tax=Catharanthus roseus TaxID=4058 RepID=A0ACB9ZLG9_CATRO|nr:hypothetical protein M9H77_34126 [Catharanthus roseus]
MLNTILGTPENVSHEHRRMNFRFMAIEHMLATQTSSTKHFPYVCFLTKVLQYFVLNMIGVGYHICIRKTMGFSRNDERCPVSIFSVKNMIVAAVMASFLPLLIKGLLISHKLGVVEEVLLKTFKRALKNTFSIFHKIQKKNFLELYCLIFFKDEERKLVESVYRVLFYSFQASLLICKEAAEKFVQTTWRRLLNCQDPDDHAKRLKKFEYQLKQHAMVLHIFLKEKDNAKSNPVLTNLWKCNSFGIEDYKRRVN